MKIFDKELCKKVHEIKEARSLGNERLVQTLLCDVEVSKCLANNRANTGEEIKAIHELHLSFLVEVRAIVNYDWDKQFNVIPWKNRFKSREVQIKELREMKPNLIGEELEICENLIQDLENEVNLYELSTNF